MNKLNLNKLIGKPIKITWYDACGEMQAERNVIDHAFPKDLLIKTISYGLLHDYDREAILILTEDSPTKVDYTVIPTSWLIKINELKGGKI